MGVIPSLNTGKNNKQSKITGIKYAPHSIRLFFQVDVVNLDRSKQNDFKELLYQVNWKSAATGKGEAGDELKKSKACGIAPCYRISG
ncbi:MAG TPA: hypothetical protein DEP36_14510 [Gammaproteobacteria bacterium]|nr:hypothetical protein [Gammaproteobacteria bacterium]HRF44569.1 hypothetical protein [Candidatus Competibacteraceae bacterium]